MPLATIQAIYGVPAAEHQATRGADGKAMRGSK